MSLKKISLDRLEGKERKEGEKLSLFDKFTDMISGIFIPILGILAATGTLKGILALFTASGILNEEMGTYIVLYAIANVLFYFFPIFLGASAAKYFKINQYLGMAIGGAMVYPTIVSSANSGIELMFLNIPINLIDYTSSVFPILASIWLASKLEKLLNILIPKSFRFLLVDLITLVTIIPITFFLVGPLLTFLGGIISKVTFAIYNFNPILGGLVLGGPWIIIVMLGLHWTLIPIFISNIAANGFDATVGLLTANQFAMAGATLAIAIKSKEKKKKELAGSMGALCLFGVGEPTLYGLLLPLKKPLIMAVIGGSVGGAVAGAFGAKLYGFGGAGILQLPLAINPSGIDLGFYGIIASAIIGFIVAFILTLIFGYEDIKEDNIEYTSI